MKGIVAILLLFGAIWPAEGQSLHNWLDGRSAADSLAARFTLRQGFDRVSVAPGSFADFLRHLPLKEKGTPLRVYSGKRVSSAAHAAAIIDLDVGTRDLQQCADTLIRLYAEYEFSAGRADTLTFNFTSGDPFSYRSYLGGLRPQVSGRDVTWGRVPIVSHSRASFRQWLDIIFTYAGTASLARDLTPVDLADARIGDLFITPGFPGHTVMIADMALNPETGAREILLIEGFTPAQDAHVLRNLLIPWRGSWFSLENGKNLRTPLWTFSPNSLYRFPSVE